MTSKSKKAEALQFLDDLDSFAPPNAPSNASTNPNAPTGAANEGEAAEVLAFLDEITQKSAEPTRTSPHIPRPGTPSMRKSTERVRIGGGTATSLQPSANSSSTSLHKIAASNSSSVDVKKAEAQSSAGNSQGWGWGSVWSTASAAIQQAKDVVDEQVKNLPKNEQARKWGEGVIGYAKSAQLDKIGQDFKRVGLSTLTDILNVVAPPISEHEVIRIWLSHDMQGYEGIESLTYRALARIMEQVEGGDLVVNRGNESRPKDNNNERDMNAVDSYDAAIKLAQANITDSIKGNTKAAKPEASNTSPTTYSDVYLRIQPFFTTYSAVHPSASGDVEPEQQLQFLIYLSDPEHKLTHTSITQAIPSKWLAIWDEYDWVEDLVAEVLRIGVEVIGQEYIVARMGWNGKAKQDTSASGNDGGKTSSIDTGEKQDKIEES